MNWILKSIFLKTFDKFVYHSNHIPKLIKDARYTKQIYYDRLQEIGDRFLNEINKEMC